MDYSAVSAYRLRPILLDYCLDNNNHSLVSLYTNNFDSVTFKAEK